MSLPAHLRALRQLLLLPSLGVLMLSGCSSVSIVNEEQTSSSCRAYLMFEAEPEWSAARAWNEMLLAAIRNDLARPTVHARNLFHVSAAMYDAWTAYEQEATPYLLNQKLGSYSCSVGQTFPTTFESQEAREAAQQEAISQAAFSLLKHRFAGCSFTTDAAEELLKQQGYAPVSAARIDQQGPAALGAAIAQCYIDYGLQDGSNEANNYANQFYEPVNNGLNFEDGQGDLPQNPNRWQPLIFDNDGFIDQSGNQSEEDRVTPEFLSAEWGNVQPFAIPDSAREERTRNGQSFIVFHDPGAPPQYDPFASPEKNEFYRWNFSLVADWSSHLNPFNGRVIDISPGATGALEVDLENLDDADYQQLYRPDGPDWGPGHALNPATNEPYEPQIVPLGDYTRVLAEFWADGPDSETPPGHWFTILNYVNDQPSLEKKFAGQGPLLSDLDWDIKAYFTLGGALHDAGIAAWSVKGWYDYVRPISAIRDLGQKERGKNGLLLNDGHIRLIEAGGDNDLGSDFIGQAEILAWQPDYVAFYDDANVDWSPSVLWRPYQPSTFVTPPFAGYVSGHSTFSRAAAEVLTAITGDPYFPGGLGEFVAMSDSFLEFEYGPSEEVRLQWATYRDASDQTSLSRIWGGIHPPVDDLPGRKIGVAVAKDAFNAAKLLFDKE